MARYSRRVWSAGFQLGHRSAAHGALVVNELVESSGKDWTRQSVWVIDAMED
jgi:hypothetical protein